MYAPEATSNTTCPFGILLGSQKAHFTNAKPKFCVWQEEKYDLQKILP